MHLDSKYVDKLHSVLQIAPQIKAGDVQIENRQVNRIAALVYIPKSDQGNIFCPLNYFQQSASVPEKWILDDHGQKFHLDGIESVYTMTVSELKNGSENRLEIPVSYQNRLFEYFKLDVTHNENTFRGFDCYAFISFIANVKYFPQKPEFNYENRAANQGEFVVLANNLALPESIKHWALYLGNDYYLSKFGKSGLGSDSLLNVMDLSGMKYLYQSNYIFTAVPIIGVRNWDGFRFEENIKN